MRLIFGAVTFLLVLGSAYADEGYYNQFRFSINGSCASVNSLSFDSASSWEMTRVGSDAQGREELVGVDVQLFDNHAFWLHYEEQSVI